MWWLAKAARPSGRTQIVYDEASFTMGNTPRQADPGGVTFYRVLTLQVPTMYRSSPPPALLTALTCFNLASPAQADSPLAGTALLELDQPLDALMVGGIDRFALSEIEAAREKRESRWVREYESQAAYENQLEPNRQRFRQLIGAVDPRVEAKGLELIKSTTQDSLVAENEFVAIHAVRWPVLDGVSAEGLFLQPKRDPIARWVAIPDADWTPEMISGLESCDTRFALSLAGMGCEVLVPTLISRDDTYSANPEIGRVTNQTHREFVYRQAFELGRHVIGYEVQKVLAAVDQFELRNRNGSQDLPIAVAGVSEGGLLALYSAAVDRRIDGVIVSGYFDQREQVWHEPIYRNDC